MTLVGFLQCRQFLVLSLTVASVMSLQPSTCWNPFRHRESGRNHRVLDLRGGLCPNRLSLEHPSPLTHLLLAFQTSPENGAVENNTILNHVINKLKTINHSRSDSPSASLVLCEGFGVDPTTASSSSISTMCRRISHR